MGKGYHFYHRVQRHEPSLLGRERDVERAVRRAASGKPARVHVHPTHVHVFTGLGEQEARRFAIRVREETSRLEGIRWDAEHYLTPVSSLDSRYVSRLLKDLHAPPLI